ncbi:MAG TPA: hypothetical protein VFV03_09070 [Solirubrobacteraceae bacterium]|nr:hypothetical protein [Solirubrobacteraceae bacterium]
MARVLIVGGASRGLRLACDLRNAGHAVRVVTGAPERCDALEQVGVECFVGTPDRLATLRGALEHVTIACWLLADASGDPELVRALHGSRLERFMCDAIDTTLRGFVYEAGGCGVPADVLARGERIVSETAARNSIPVAILTADPVGVEVWSAQALAAVRSLLEGTGAGIEARYAAAYIPKSRSAFGDEASTQEDS